jgi:hypothetical protein
MNFYFGAIVFRSADNFIVVPFYSFAENQQDATESLYLNTQAKFPDIAVGKIFYFMDKVGIEKIEKMLNIYKGAKK